MSFDLIYINPKAEQMYYLSARIQQLMALSLMFLNAPEKAGSHTTKT